VLKPVKLRNKVIETISEIKVKYKGEK